MLAFLVDRCGAQQKELPQLVALRNLLRQEERGADFAAEEAVTSAVAETPAAPPPQTASETSRVFHTQPSLSNAEPLHQPHHKEGPNSSALGFILCNSASMEPTGAEASNFPMLTELYNLLRHESEEGTQVPPVAVPLTTVLSSSTAGASSPLIATASTAAYSASTVSGSAVPLPIVPTAGGWHGVFGAPSGTTAGAPPPPPQFRHPSERPRNPSPLTTAASPPVSPPLADRATVVPVGGASSRIPRKPRTTSATERHGGRPATEMLSSPIQDGLETSSAQTAASSTSRGHGHGQDGTPPSTSTAGRMPCPPCELLANGHGLSNGHRSPHGCGSETEAVGIGARQPLSHYARRFLSDLYERVSTPVSQFPSHSSLCATGSGIKAARGRRTSVDAVAMQANAVPSAPRTGLLHHRLPRPSASSHAFPMPPPAHRSPPRHAAARSFLHQHGSAVGGPRHPSRSPSAGPSPTVAGHRRSASQYSRCSSAGHARRSSAGVAEKATGTGFMIVGERIPLPSSSGYPRSRYV